MSPIMGCSACPLGTVASVLERVKVASDWTLILVGCSFSFVLTTYCLDLFFPTRHRETGKKNEFCLKQNGTRLLVLKTYFYQRLLNYPSEERAVKFRGVHPLKVKSWMFCALRLRTGQGNGSHAVGQDLLVGCSRVLDLT